MNLLKLSIITLWLLGVPAAFAASEEMRPEDYVGFSMQVPKKTQEMIGLKTAKVETTSAREKIAVSGRIMQDIENLAQVYPPQSGRLKQCAATIGESVAKGQVVCLVDVPEKCLEVTSPIAGVVIAQFARDGEPVDPIFPIMTVGDLSTISANFDVYEKDIGKVHPGQQVSIRASAYPHQIFQGKIAFVSPRVDETTFTIRIRVAIDNKDLLLKPGMFVSGEILVEGEKARLKMPTDAVQNLDGINVVFLKEDEEFFTPTEVHVQYAGRTDTFVDADLKAGDRVVTEGAFVLKSKILESEIVGGCAHGH